MTAENKDGKRNASSATAAEQATMMAVVGQAHRQSLRKELSVKPKAPKKAQTWNGKRQKKLQTGTKPFPICSRNQTSRRLLPNDRSDKLV